MSTLIYILKRNYIFNKKKDLEAFCYLMWDLKIVLINKGFANPKWRRFILLVSIINLPAMSLQKPIACNPTECHQELKEWLTISATLNFCVSLVVNILKGMNIQQKCDVKWCWMLRAEDIQIKTNLDVDNYVFPLKFHDIVQSCFLCFIWLSLSKRRGNTVLTDLDLIHLSSSNWWAKIR